MNEPLEGEASLIVRIEDTACHIALSPEDQFPELFATARMVALMEVAAARAMRPMLGPGQLSVGVSLNVRHTAPTLVGSQVRAVARWQRSENRLVHFIVEAFDEAGSIGAGEHTRAVIDSARLLSGARRRRAIPASSTSSS